MIACSNGVAAFGPRTSFLLNVTLPFEALQRLPQPEPRPRLPVRVASHTAGLVKAAQGVGMVAGARSSKRSGEP